MRTRDERRLVEIRWKLEDLGTNDRFNVTVRRDALTKVEANLIIRIERKRVAEAA